MTDENKEILQRKSSVLIPLGIRVGHTDEIMVIDFLDPDFPGQILSSVALTKSIALKLLSSIHVFIENGK